MSVPFYKMTGSGNDFVVLDGRREPADAWPAARIRAICDRRHGAGADGFVILSPGSDGSVQMHFYNCDGGRAAMCGNAALCSTALAAHLGMGDPAGMSLVTDAGTYRTRAPGQPWAAEINLLPFHAPAGVAGISNEPGEAAIALATVGVPHLVILVADVDGVELERRGRELRFHPALGEAGANANFISPPRGTDGCWRIRTYERGVEGETQACGTGTVAAAAFVAGKGLGEFPIRFRSRGGPVLSVSALVSGAEVLEVWLSGEGRLVYRGDWMERAGAEDGSAP